LSTQKDSLVEEIIDFLIFHGDGVYSYNDREYLKKAVSKMLRVGTCLMVRDKEGISTFTGWNYIGTNTAWILFLVKKKNIKIRDLLKLLKLKRPEFEYIAFERLKKYPDRKMRTYKIMDLIGG
jgi:hypothetical protein